MALLTSRAPWSTLETDAKEATMYCDDCGELVTEDRYGNPIHDYRLADSHAPVVSQ